MLGRILYKIFRYLSGISPDLLILMISSYKDKVFLQYLQFRKPIYHIFMVFFINIKEADFMHCIGTVPRRQSHLSYFLAFTSFLSLILHPSSPLSVFAET